MNHDLVRSESPSPFMGPNGEVDVRGLCTALPIGRPALSEVTGLSRQAISHYFDRNVRFIKLRASEARTFFVKLNHIYVLIRAVMGENVTKRQISDWFHAPNKALGMKTPRDVVLEKKLDILIEKLMDVIEAAHGG